MNNVFVFLTSIAVYFFILIDLANISAEAAGVWGKPYKLNRLNKAEVKNLNGEKLGEIEDFIIDPRSGHIVLVIFSHVGMSGIGQKVKIIPFGFLYFNEKEKYFLLNADKEDLTSEVVVKNLQGEELGKIEDFVINSQGMITLAILSHNETPIIVPYSGLSLDQSGKFYILDASHEKLASAPVFEEDSISQSQAEEIYRYFGLRPYWTYDEKEKPILPHLTPLPEF
jgi:sporulation protein YlmC with PRC-barrel domain